MIIGSATDTGGIVVTDNITASGSPTLELLTGGAITDPGGFTLDPMNVALMATTGIGTGRSADDDRCHQSRGSAPVTGGIFIDNTGDLTIGYTGDPFQGVTVTGALGDPISLTNAGSIDITTLNGKVVNLGPGIMLVSRRTGSPPGLDDGRIQRPSRHRLRPAQGMCPSARGRDVLIGDPNVVVPWQLANRPFLHLGSVSTASGGIAINAGGDFIVDVIGQCGLPEGRLQRHNRHRRQKHHFASKPAPRTVPGSATAAPARSILTDRRKGGRGEFNVRCRETAPW